MRALIASSGIQERFRPIVLLNTSPDNPPEHATSSRFMTRLSIAREENQEVSPVSRYNRYATMLFVPAPSAWRKKTLSGSPNGSGTGEAKYRLVSDSPTAFSTPDLAEDAPRAAYAALSEELFCTALLRLFL
jgi:hypothetical protein